MGQKKSEITRRRIIEAARRIFCAYPYDAASVRKIEQAGGFNYALIRYYCGSKKGLFDTVTAELVTEYINGILPLLKILSREPIEKALPEFIDRLFDWCFSHPDGMAIIMLNIGKGSQFDGSLLGMDAIKAYITEIQRQVAGIAPREISEKHRAMIVLAFTLITINSIGAANFHATAQDMAADSTEYRQWVKDAVRFVFLPLVNNRAAIADRPAGELAPENLEKLAAAEPSPVPMDEPEKMSKGDATRKRILDSAQSVFTKHPYHSASIRMIGREGNFDFTIIHHYFPTKENLAKAVIDRFYEEFFQASNKWMTAFLNQNFDTMTLRQGFAVYMEHLLDFYFNAPDAPAILIQNIVKMDSPDLDALHHHARRFYLDIFNRLKSVLSLRATRDHIRMWQFCLVTLIISCVGASHYLAQILDMAPDSTQYRNWLNEFFVYIFFPGLMELMGE
jgi:AcrR family transcriptional regulator